MNYEKEEDIERLEELIISRKRNLRLVNKFYEEEKAKLIKDSAEHFELKILTSIVIYSHYLSIINSYSKLTHTYSLNNSEEIDSYLNKYKDEMSNFDNLTEKAKLLNYDTSKNINYELDIKNHCVTKIEVKRKIGF